MALRFAGTRAPSPPAKQDNGRAGQPSTPQRGGGLAQYSAGSGRMHLQGGFHFTDPKASAQRVAGRAPTVGRIQGGIDLGRYVGPQPDISSSIGATTRKGSDEIFTKQEADKQDALAAAERERERQELLQEEGAALEWSKKRGRTPFPEVKSTNELFDEYMLEVENPFRKPARKDPDYDPSTMLPASWEEADLAAAWLREHEIFTDRDAQGRAIIVGSGGLEKGTGGKEVDVQPRYATEDDLRLIEYQEQLWDEINDVRQRALDFQAKAVAAAQQRATHAALASLEDAKEKFKFDLERQGMSAGQLEDLEVEFQNRIGLIEAEGAELRETNRVRHGFDMALTERKFDLDAALQKSKQDFAAAQNALDRSLQALALEESQRAAQALEALDRQRIALEQQEFKLGIFSFLAQSPEMLFFMEQTPGLKESFSGLLDDADENAQLRTALDDMIEDINAKPTTNVQEFARLTGTEQGLERFRISAATGTRKEDVNRALLGQAPAVAGLPAPGSMMQRMRLGR